MNAKAMTKLLQVQQALKAPKNLRNSFGGYNYRSCENILEAVKPILIGANATIIISDEIVQMGDRFYVKATATFVELDGGESISVSAFAREALTKKGMDESQITGACSSYARKYALNGLLLIDDTKDADSMDNTEAPVSAPAPMMTDAQKAKLAELGVDIAKLAQYYKTDAEHITQEQAAKAIAMKEKKNA